MKKIYNLLYLFVIAALTLIVPGCDDNNWSEDYDIDWPVSAIESISAEEVTIDDIVTITGTNLDKVYKIYLADQECAIVDGSATATQIQFVVGRRASTGFIKLENVYDRVFETTLTVKVNYPGVNVTSWPDKLVSGEAFTIEGENVDLITEVIINGQVVKISNPSETTKISVPTAGMVLIPGETASIQLVALGELNESEKSEIPIEAPSDIFEAASPIVLWDFESGAPVMEEIENAPEQADINLGGLTKARGNNYYSVINPGETSGWKTYFYIKYGQSVDLSEFHEPNITFLVNTNGKRGYINPFMTQDGSRVDNHLNDGNANENLKYGDNYAVETNGWEWRSYPIKKLFKDFNATGVFDDIEMRFISGNVANGDVNPEDFEIHVDQIMITDGPVNPIAKIFDFEEAEPTYEENTPGANYGLNLTGVDLGAGDQYYSVTIAEVPGSWKWMGAIGNYNAVDLSTMIDPHISFIVNTGGKKGMVQVETWQNDTKWGGSVDVTNYFLETDGWTPVTVRLADMLGNWGGDASEFDPTAPIDYVKLGFTTGNIESGAYEVNIDDVYITDGPMW